MIVAKFGGSSVRDAAGIRRCGALVETPPCPALIILSATYNTTNLLEKMAKAETRQESLEVFYQIKKKHDRLIQELGLPKNLLEELYSRGENLTECSGAGDQDRLYALGELLSSTLFAAYLKKTLSRPVVLVDARELIITDNTFGQAKPLLEEIAQRVHRRVIPFFEKDSLVVTQGFIGSTLAGETTTLGREGSDYSATLLAEAIGAESVYIWSDVPGVFTADPKLIPAAKVIPEISYALAETMAERGAKILFPQTLGPAARGNIAVFVGSSLEPKKGGSWIRSVPGDGSGPVALTLSRSRISLIGRDLDNLTIDLPEIEKGELFRTFQVPGDTQECERVFIQLHKSIF